MTYAHNSIFDSIRSYQLGKESWSLPSLTTCKKIRTAAWMQNNLENAVEAFMEKFKCRRKMADRFFREANCLHRRKEAILLDDEEEEREILEKLAGEEDDDMLEIFWNEIHANAVRKAFDRLTSDEKEYLQGNAVPFGILSQQGAPRPYWITQGQRNCHPFGIPARFEMSTHKGKMNCGHSFQNAPLGRSSAMVISRGFAAIR